MGNQNYNLRIGNLQSSQPPDQAETVDYPDHKIPSSVTDRNPNRQQCSHTYLGYY